MLFDPIAADAASICLSDRLEHRFADYHHWCRILFAIAEGLALATGRVVYARASTRPESFRSRSTWVSSREW